MYCQETSASSAYTKCTNFRSVLGGTAGSCSSRTWNTAAHSNSKTHPEIQYSIISSSVLRYSFFCLISKYSFEKGLLQDTRMLRCQQRSQKIGLLCLHWTGASFLTNKGNSTFCENMIKTGHISKISHQN